MLGGCGGAFFEEGKIRQVKIFIFPHTNPNFQKVRRGFDQVKWLEWRRNLPYAIEFTYVYSVGTFAGTQQLETCAKITSEGKTFCSPQTDSMCSYC